jgi:hypothetical protein
LIAALLLLTLETQIVAAEGDDVVVAHAPVDLVLKVHRDNGR